MPSRGWGGRRKLFEGPAATCPGHEPYVDGDGDTVCRLCRLVMKLGPLGPGGKVSEPLTGITVRQGFPDDPTDLPFADSDS